MMEEFEQQKAEEVKLVVTEDMRSYLYDITKWAKFLSVVGFVISVFIILAAFSIPALVNSNPAIAAQMGQLGASGATIITVIYFVMGLLLFYPSILLNRVANKGKQGVLFGDQENLNQAISNLKSLFKFWGIVTIAIIAFYFLMIFLVGAGMAVA
ncbi:MULTISPECIES: DUF5362 family protein [Pedobacter]|uniref:DUF5362 family protein n=1 Tax=Pedobacter agri TaxID=454586 RepID=A0A9X3IAC9_9SPHI|nr:MULTISPECIES: DUF5362 family protein [Pedobacter]AZI27739.1 hypothetical protein EA772_21195 [Pedobacter sp. G11]MCX3266741.1 DUF5362 family protein [Pedobacter agri]